MNDLLVHEPQIRLICMLGVFAAMAVWEILAPRRVLNISKAYRWTNNLAIVAFNSLLLRIIFPAAAVGIAVGVETQGWGLFKLISWPTWLVVLLSIIALDFVIWVQHVLFHSVPVFWRLHRMHHTDQDFDVTTGLRFHPLEILLSMLIKGGAIVVLGTPPVAVLIFEILLNATSMFNHGNVRLPASIDKLLRLLVVTPDMHRVHHSWYPNETNSNFGFNLSLWDRLLGTYKAQPRDGHSNMTIGLNAFRLIGDQRLDRMLVQPLIGPTNSYPINKRE